MDDRVRKATGTPVAKKNAVARKKVLTRVHQRLVFGPRKEVMTCGKETEEEGCDQEGREEETRQEEGSQEDREEEKEEESGHEEEKEEESSHQENDEAQSQEEKEKEIRLRAFRPAGGLRSDAGPETTALLPRESSHSDSEGALATAAPSFFVRRTR